MLMSINVVSALQLRQYIATPTMAPQSIRGIIEGLPEDFAAKVLVWVPDITWHYWILPAMAITMVVGALGRRKRAE